MHPPAEEDVRLVVHVQALSDDNMLPKLKLDQWNDVFPKIDALKRVHLLGASAFAS